MNNDLISREALKLMIENFQIFNPKLSVYDVLKIIDNAPTVEAYPFEQVQELVKLNQQFAQEIENLKRPHGKWLTHQTGLLMWEECNQCHAQVGTVGMNFCPNCGTDMRKEADNE